MIKKINKIFDDAAKENNEFEESYTALKRPAANKSSSHSQIDQSSKEISSSFVDPNPAKPVKKVSIQEDHSYYQGHQQPPMVVPVIINSNEQHSG